ncbi:uncharacterized protein LOC142172621 [Nicotiana tabacum]|uniref:Uncharacterized protein LOC142172621 n=1 Tax=Nicotiana tabacum TaxID=4097 RepID=A0AC58T580_TOBAC
MYLEVFRRELGFDNAASNKNGKIWCFWDHNITCTVVKDHRQQITFIVKHAQFMQNFCIAAIYAKTSSQKRMRLWNSLRKIKDHVDGPWAIFGDFNVITHADEKNGGRMHRLAQSLDFLNCMGDCGMMDAGYVGNPFTWTNGRRKTKKIMRRLARTGSDHNALLLKCAIEDAPPIKYFKFLRFWTEKPEFHNVVQECWGKDIMTSLLKVKTKVKWEEEGENSTKYFHSIIRQRRKKAYLHRIKNEEGTWVQGKEQMAQAAEAHFSQLFSQPVEDKEFSILKRIEKSITTEYNELLIKIPTITEIKEAVWSLDPTSAARPDGMNGSFYQSCWDIIVVDLCNMPYGFFKSTRGVKQGDPLSPTLFILATEALSRGLNHLHDKEGYVGFSMHQQCPQINHLSYANDLVIFTSGDKKDGENDHEEPSPI